MAELKKKCVYEWQVEPLKENINDKFNQSISQLADQKSRLH